MVHPSSTELGRVGWVLCQCSLSAKSAPTALDSVLRKSAMKLGKGAVVWVIKALRIPIGPLVGSMDNMPPAALDRQAY